MVRYVSVYDALCCRIYAFMDKWCLFRFICLIYNRRAFLADSGDGVHLLLNAVGETAALIMNKLGHLV